MHTYSPNKMKKFKQMLSARNMTDGNGFLGQERSVNGKIYATRECNNVTSILQKTKKTA
jgi:hypothetical protein